jgi:periplasmic divalent cation tolerance protein
VTDFIQVMTTTANMTDAQRIAQVVVEQRLAGCVQIIGPIRSIYWWEAEIRHSEEYLCLIKTRADVYEELSELIKSAHPYDVPEILAVPVSHASENYLSWLNGEIGKGSSAP